jgi:hypothetical protein
MLIDIVSVMNRPQRGRAAAISSASANIAWAQALAVERGLRQKDVIDQWPSGEWRAPAEVIDGPRKWLLGLRRALEDEDLRKCPTMMDALAHLVRLPSIARYRPQPTPMIADLGTSLLHCRRKFSPQERDNLDDLREDIEINRNLARLRAKTRKP